MGIWCAVDEVKVGDCCEANAYTASADEPYNGLVAVFNSSEILDHLVLAAEGCLHPDFVFVQVGADILCQGRDIIARAVEEAAMD